MGAAKANNSKDTYLATAVTFMVIGALFLIDKLIHFSSIGLPWVMNKDNMLLYAAACFLIFKRDKYNRGIFYTSFHRFFSVLQTNIRLYR